jgi:hypothetical protein
MALAFRGGTAMRKSPRTWIWAPPKRAIPKEVQDTLRNLLEKHAYTKWKKVCRKVEVRFRGAYAYVDAFPVKTDYPHGATADQRARIDATPVSLCRLGYLGDPDRWEYAFFKYSDEKYEPSISISGDFTATPEEAFDTSAGVYLME